jgi:hypothetical protein
LLTVKEGELRVIGSGYGPKWALMANGDGIYDLFNDVNYWGHQAS